MPLHQESAGNHLPILTDRSDEQGTVKVVVNSRAPVIVFHGVLCRGGDRVVVEIGAGGTSSIAR